MVKCGHQSIKTGYNKSCFVKAGFRQNVTNHYSNEGEVEDSNHNNEEYEDIEELCNSIGHTLLIKDFLNIDNNLCTDNKKFNTILFKQM